MSAVRFGPPRAKMFTPGGDIEPAAYVALVAIRKKNPEMKPQVPPLTVAERDWLMSFIDEWAHRLERGLVSREVLEKYKDAVS